MEEQRSILDSKGWRRALEIIFALFILIGALGDAKSLPSSLKVVSLGAIALGFVVLFVTGDMRGLKKVGSFFGIYGFILLAIIVWSVFLWIIHMETVSFIGRGTLKFAYQFLVLLIICSGVYMLGERSIYAVFYGLAGANIIIALITIPTYGVQGCIDSFVHFFTNGGEQIGYMRELEIHDITFTYGFFLIYFTLFAKKDKERIVDMVISIVLFVLGWKRIAMGALVLVVVCGFALGFVRNKARVITMNVICWAAMLLSFGYVLFIRYDLFNVIMEQLNINTMGRDQIYDFIQPYYDISIAFLGYGFEYTSVLLRNIVNNFPELKIGVLALHNNILTEYIELGFLGFWAWLFYTWLFQYRWLINHQGEMVSMLFIMCETYIFMTYLTDNTLYYYWTSMVLRLMPMAYSLHTPEHKDQFHWPWIKVKKI